MTVTEVLDLKGAPMTFAGVTYGGGRDREYKYGDAPPSDIPWLSEILDPVIFAELTEPAKNNPASIKWKKIKDVPASDLVYLLPSRDSVETGSNIRVTLLSMSAEKETTILPTVSSGNVGLFTILNLQFTFSADQPRKRPASTGSYSPAGAFCCWRTDTNFNNIYVVFPVITVVSSASDGAAVICIK